MYFLFITPLPLSLRQLPSCTNILLNNTGFTKLSGILSLSYANIVISFSLSLDSPFSSIDLSVHVLI